MTNDLLPCREAFEKWLTADGNYPHLKHKNFGGGYLNDEAAMKWDGWKTAWNTRAKPAEADLDALQAAVMKWALPDTDFVSVRRTLNYLRMNGHLATGKGGGELEEDTKKVIHLHDNGWKPVFNPPYEDTKYTLSKLPEGIISSAGFERLSFEDAVTVQRCLEKLSPAATQPAAPTQIDAGELEAALRYYGEDNSGRMALFDSTDEDFHPHFKTLLKSARAHLEKSKGGV